jgi:hypothetical protein
MTTGRLPKILLNCKLRRYWSIGWPTAKWENVFSWSRELASDLISLNKKMGWMDGWTDRWRDWRKDGSNRVALKCCIELCLSFSAVFTIPVPVHLLEILRWQETTVPCWAAWLHCILLEILRKTTKMLKYWTCFGRWKISLLENVTTISLLWADETSLYYISKI